MTSTGLSCRRPSCLTTRQSMIWQQYLALRTALQRHACFELAALIRCTHYVPDASAALEVAKVVASLHLHHLYARPQPLHQVRELIIGSLGKQG